ncbi:MAG: insulinase family protein [Deltaproteobacteria bacterium]|nr:insulinase family protein [Deltaproteobacteria bacterium]
MIRRILIISCVLVTSACSWQNKKVVAVNTNTSTLENESSDFRAQPPVAKAEPQITPPVAIRYRLDNGLLIFVVPKHDLPLVSINVVFKSGSASDPQQLSGVAGFVGEMLLSGTKTRSAKELASEIETYGTHLNVQVNEDDIHISSLALKNYWIKVLAILADAITNSTFSDEELQRVRKKRIASIAKELDDPETLAMRVLRKAVFAEHPYAHTVLGNKKDAEAIKHSDIIAYVNENLHAANAALIVIGDITTQQVIDQATKHFSEWQGKPSAKQQISDANLKPAKVVILNRPKAQLSFIMLGQLGIARNSGDYLPTVLMNSVLGGMFNSRLNMNLREDKGYTYGAYSYFDSMRYTGIFLAAAGVRTDVTIPALREFYTEIKRIKENGITVDELKHAKNGITLSLPARFQTVSSIASMIRNIYLYDFKLTYYNDLSKMINEIDLNAVQSAAKEHLAIDNLSLVIVGDYNTFKTELNKLDLGAIEVRETYH